MGGYGSGQRYGYVKRLVEDGYTFSISTIKENIKRIDLAGVVHSGAIGWSVNGEIIAKIGYYVINSEGLRVEFSYTITRMGSDEKIKLDYPVQLETKYQIMGVSAIGFYVR
jgi:hypothetical protein